MFLTPSFLAFLLSFWGGYFWLESRGEVRSNFKYCVYFILYCTSIPKGRTHSLGEAIPHRPRFPCHTKLTRIMCNFKEFFFPPVPFEEMLIKVLFKFPNTFILSGLNLHSISFFKLNTINLMRFILSAGW